MNNANWLLRKKQEEKVYPFIKNLPDWFDLNNYQNAYQLDLEGWINQLYLRQFAQGFCKRLTFTGVCEDFFLPITQYLPEPRKFIKPISTHQAMLIVEAVKDSYDIPEEVWLSPSNFKLDINNTDLLTWHHNQTIENPSLKELPFIHQANYTILQGLISVDLEVPDVLLINAFKHWLVNQRASKSAPRKRTFTKTLLRRWATNQILPYIDLLYWSRLSEVQIPHWLMGEALFPGNAQSDKIDRIRKTTEKSAKQAMSLGYLHAMAAQLNFETGKSLDLDFYCRDFNGATQQKVLISPI